MEPLTILFKERGSLKFKWTKEADLTFEELRTQIATARISKDAEPFISLILEVNGVKAGIGAGLFQGQGEPLMLFPCTFFSRKLSFAQRECNIRNQKLLAI